MNNLINFNQVLLIKAINKIFENYKEIIEINTDLNNKIADLGNELATSDFLELLKLILEENRVLTNSAMKKYEILKRKEEKKWV